MADETPFSFHCMVCFEEFDPEDRYPVVLPCGHTYVCSTCSERLDKCMECRTPLYYLVPKNTATAPTTAGTTSATAAVSSRSSWSSAARRLDTTNAPPPQHIKKRLPLPKNVVLLSLIEATELASQHVRNKSEPSPTHIDNNNNNDFSDTDSVTTSPGASWKPLVQTIENSPGDIRSMGSMIDVEEDEEVRIKMGTSLAVGVAGTYAVAAADGLQIYPTKPSTMPPEEDVDLLVNNFHHHHHHHELHQQQHQHQQHDVNKSTASQGSPRNPARLSYGDRVQVVSLEQDGWAKLARGYGYARAENGSLVKVGNALDKACKLEAILRNLSSRRKDLRLEQTQIDNMFIQTMNSLQASLQNDEDLTVIVADTFSCASTKQLKCPAGEDAEEKEQRAPASPPDNVSLEKARLKQEQQKEQQDSTPPRSSLTRFGCFSTDVFDTGEQLVERTRAAFPNIPPSALYEAFIPNTQSVDHHIQTSASHPSPSAMREGARAWRERHRQQPRTGIDFRTGMSGHKALYSPQARHPHAFLESGSSWTRLKMSSHTGLSTARLKHPAILPSASQPPGSNSSLLGSFAPSMMGQQQLGQDESRDQVSHSDSM